MNSRNKKVLAYVILGVLVVGIGIGIYFLFVHEPDPSLRIRYTSAQDIVHHRDLGDSRLFIHPNGTFEIEIIQSIGDERLILFTGVGTYTSTRNSYTFTFTDSETYHYIGPQLTVNTRPPFPIVERGRIRFDAHWGISYHFGR